MSNIFKPFFCLICFMYLLISSAQAQLSAGVGISGGDGSSMADAVVITVNATARKHGIPTIYGYLHEFHPGHILIGQSLMAEHMGETVLASMDTDGHGNVTRLRIGTGIRLVGQGRIFDRIQILNYSGEHQFIFFEITSFFDNDKSEKAIEAHERYYAAIVKHMDEIAQETVRQMDLALEGEVIDYYEQQLHDEM